MKRKIKAINYHLWEPCNMRCKFCFATFQDVKQAILPKGHLPKEQSIQLIHKIAEYGFEKITFVGGEPTLCPWLSELILIAKQLGLTTMIVTNGTKLTEDFLSKNEGILDWITVSIDSINNDTNLKTGRAILGKRPLSLNDYKELFDRIKKFDYRIKVNTVVNSENVYESLEDIISYAKPERWKIFQALPIKGQNNGRIEELLINDEDFQLFVERHEKMNELSKVISENNDEMQGSYVMIDPAGRFFDNVDGKHEYSKSILEFGIDETLNQIRTSYEKFTNRNGEYDWGKSQTLPNRITLS